MGDNFCDFLFVFLKTNPFLKRALLYWEKICPFSEGDKKHLYSAISPESVPTPLKFSMPALVAQPNVCLIGDQKVAGLIPLRSCNTLS